MCSGGRVPDLGGWMRTIGSARRPLLLGALVLALAGCASDSYPLVPQGSESWHPTAVGAAVEGVVLYLEPRTGDQIELLGAEPVGLPGGVEASFYYAPNVRSNGTHNIGDQLEPLAGATFGAPARATSGPDYTVGVVARLVPRVAGTFTLTGVRLRFRINGSAAQERDGITEVFTVCAAEPAPTDCGPGPSG